MSRRISHFRNLPIQRKISLAILVTSASSTAIGAAAIFLIYLVSSYPAEYSRSIGLYAAILGNVLIVSVVLALILSDRLQRLISTPILRLAATAQQVAQKQDYSLRAEKLAEDEVGQLTDAFNEM